VLQRFGRGLPLCYGLRVLNRSTRLALDVHGHMLIRGQHVAQAWKDCSLRTETGCCLPSRPEIVQQPAKIDHPKTATALNLRSHSIDKLNRYGSTTGAL
jgi:hypothetical protein